jgi:hypothetical protein
MCFGFLGLACAQENETPTAQDANDLERQAKVYDKWSEDRRQSAEGWRQDAATMRKVAREHNNDKTALETAAYYERLAKEIDAEANRLHQKAEQLRQEAQELRKQQPASDLTGFWQDSSGKITVHLAQSGADLALDLGNGIVLNGVRNGSHVDLKYIWTAEAAAKHIKSEKESGPQAQADRDAAIKALAGKTVALKGTVNDKADTITGFYDDNWTGDAETNRSGTSVQTQSPSRTALTLHRKRSEPRCSSLTFATVPANRSRHRIGVGEEVALKFSSEESTMGLVPQWSVAGGGRLSPASGLNAVFIAGDRGGSAMITARASSGQSCSILFTVVEPDNVFLQMVPGSEYHVKGHLSAGFLGKWFVTPSDVSFSKIEIRELDALAPAVGELEPVNDFSHGPNPAFADMGPTVEGVGTPTAEGHLDRIGFKIEHSSFGMNDPLKNGKAAFRIPYEYRVGAAGTPKVFTHVIQLVVAKNGICTISKGGVSVTKKNEDETTPSWQQFHMRDP